MQNPTLNYAQGGYQRRTFRKPPQRRGLAILSVLGLAIFLAECVLFGATLQSEGWSRIGLLLFDVVAFLINLGFGIFVLAYWYSHKWSSSELSLLIACTTGGPLISVVNLILCFTLPDRGGC